MGFHSIPCVRRAGPDEAAELATLVNRAYEVERAFVDGERTDAAEIRRLMDGGDFFVLGARGDAWAVVFVEARGDRGALGMLSVAPERQGQGLGRRLVALAEAWCAAMGCATLSLEVVSLRTELEAWYRSLGYRAIGTSPYEHRVAKRPCHLVRMEKRLDAALAA
jgi:GNAT superfamily N-acetyltransferase